VIAGLPMMPTSSSVAVWSEPITRASGRRRETASALASASRTAAGNGRFVGQRRFVHAGRLDVEALEQAPEQFAAIAGGGGEDQGWRRVRALAMAASLVGWRRLGHGPL